MLKIEPHPYPFNDRKVETSTENLFLKYQDIIFSDKETLKTPAATSVEMPLAAVTSSCVPKASS